MYLLNSLSVVKEECSRFQSVRTFHVLQSLKCYAVRHLEQITDQSPRVTLGRWFVLIYQCRFLNKTLLFIRWMTVIRRSRPLA